MEVSQGEVPFAALKGRLIGGEELSQSEVRFLRIRICFEVRSVESGFFRVILRQPPGHSTISGQPFDKLRTSISAIQPVSGQHFS